MTCLSLHQPWATLLRRGAKRCETRSGRTEYRGPLLIHACVSFPPAARALCQMEPFSDALLKAGITYWEQLPLGAVLGVAALVECYAAEVLRRLREPGTVRSGSDCYRGGQGGAPPRLVRATTFAMPGTLQPVPSRERQAIASVSGLPPGQR